jgi:haloalkane dehalogenase
MYLETLTMSTKHNYFKSHQSISAKSIFPDYHYQPNFVEIDNVKLHFIEEGEKDAPTILFLLGVPTWSYTFRKIFPVCLNAGYRIIAPDLPGFGKSDKPLSFNNYSISRLVELIGNFVQQQELKDIFLFAHDWGAIIGMMLAAKNPKHFAGLITCNGYLPDLDAKSPFIFRMWSLFCKHSPILPIGRIVDFACERKLSPAERKAYDFPFSNNKEKIAIRVLPELIPVIKGDKDAALIRECWKKLESWEKPFLTVFSTNDKITRGGEKILQRRIPGAKNQAHKIVKGKHFIQEDIPNELGLIITDFVKNNT